MLTRARSTLTRRLLPSLLIATSGQAVGQSIFVQQFTAGQWQSLPGGGSVLPSGSDVNIDLSGSETIRIFTDDPAATDIGLITVTAPDGATPTILIAGDTNPGVNPTQSLGTIAARSIGGLIAPARSTVQVHAGSVTGAGIEAGRVVRLDLTGDLDAPVINWGTQGQSQPGIAVIDIDGSVTANGSIVAVNGRIDSIDIAGDVLGDIAAQNGGMVDVTIGGSVGDASTDPTIYGWTGVEDFAIHTLDIGGSLGSPTAPARVLAGGPVMRIEADEIHAQIDTQINPDDPGSVGGIIARTGDLTGSVLIRELTSYGGWPDAPCAISVAGDLDAQVFLDVVLRNENPNGPEIDIAGNVSADSIISVNGMIKRRTDLPGASIRVAGDEGVQGTIIVYDRPNAEFDVDEAVDLPGVGLVVTPETKQYATLFEDIGGGSVAIAPFNFHPAECFPQHNETINIEPGSSLIGAVVRLYGPAFGAAPAFLVEHRADPALPWIDRSTDFMTFVPTDETQSSRDVRIEAVGAASFEPGEWRLRPVDGTILSAFTPGLPGIRFDSEYADDTYRFVVRSECDDTGGRTTLNDARGQDVEDYITPVDPGSNPCP